MVVLSFHNIFERLFETYSSQVKIQTVNSIVTDLRGKRACGNYRICYIVFLSLETLL